MHYFKYKQASSTSKSMKGFALALFIVFQVLNPGLLSVPMVHASTLDGSVCFVAGGDTVDNTITSFGVSTDGANKQLQDVLDTAGYSINTLTQETGYQVWNIPTGQTSVTITPKFIQGYSAASNTFGYYTNGDIATFKPVFTASSILPGDVSAPIVINTASTSNIAFAIQSTYGGSTKVFATQSTISGTDNGGDDHAVVYTPNNKTYVIGFEDVLLAASDNDYQDMAIEFRVENCEQVDVVRPTLYVQTFVDGVPVNVSTANGLSFNYKAVVGTVASNNTLSLVNNFTASSTSDTSPAATVSLNEVLTAEDPNSMVVDSLANCVEGKYYLSGYTFSNTAFDTNSANIATTSPIATNVSTDMYAVIWNNSCPKQPAQPPTNGGGTTSDGETRTSRSSTRREITNVAPAEGIVLGATAGVGESVSVVVPGLPNTGNGGSTNMFAIAVSILVGFAVVNMVGARYILSNN